MNTIEIWKIVVPNSFAKTKPSEKKLNAVRKHVEKYAALDKPVVLQGDLLIDGYVRYLVAKEYEMKRIPYVQTSDLKTIDENKPPKYIIGRFETSMKEYVWKLPHKVNVEIGDRVLVDSRFNKKNRGVVTVVKVFTSTNKEMLRHKKVIKKLPKKTGEST